MTAPRAWFKWTVYAILVVDFFIYLAQDIQSAPYTLDPGSGPLEVLAAYVTTIDLVAWFTLIVLFEVETGAMAGRTWTGASRWAVRGLRLACYAAILHTSFSYDIALREFLRPAPLPPATDLCAYAGEWSFLRNRDYLDIDATNCASLGRGPDFFALGGDRILTDRAGLEEGRILAWTDLVESLAWLLVVLLIEASLRLEARAPAFDRLIALLQRLTVVPYALILGIAAYWGSKGQVLYLWDEIIWVLGFLVIEGNLRAARRAPRLSAWPKSA
jgi:hypothetical protein